MYVVTEYGCNSTPNDLVTPSCTLFENYENAYNYFLQVSPDLNDRYNKAKQYRNKKFNQFEDFNTEEEILIEFRVHVPLSYIDDDDDEECGYAKRPCGASIAKCRVKK